MTPLLLWGFFFGTLALIVLGVPRHIIPWFACLAFVLLAVTGVID